LQGESGRYIRGHIDADEQQQPRNAEYLSQLDATYMLDAATSPDDFFSPILLVDSAYRCWGSTPIRRNDGSVDCRVHVLTSDMSPCDQVRGWLDPLAENGKDRAPKTELHEKWGEVRVCEIRQLESSALERCLQHPEQPQ